MKKNKLFIQLMSRETYNATQQLFELITPIEGFNQVIVSVKADGVDGLSGSYFIFGTTDGCTLEKELAWDCFINEFNHDKILANYITPKQ